MNETLNNKLFQAVKKNNTADVKTLLKAGVDVNARNRGWTALHYASVKRCRDMVDMVKLLINEGADIHAKTDNGGTALHFASHGGQFDIMKRLIAASADVNAKVNCGFTALHFASGQGHADIVKILIDAGADIDAKNNDEKKPLDIADPPAIREILSQ